MDLKLKLSLIAIPICFTIVIASIIYFSNIFNSTNESYKLSCSSVFNLPKNKGYFGYEVHYSVSTGIKRPNSTISFNVYSISSNVPSGYYVLVKLYLVENKECKKIYEEIGGLNYKLPNKEYIEYIIVAKLTNNEGKVLDSVYSFINVPHFDPRKVKVELSLDKDVYHKYDNVRYTIINNAAYSVGFGAEYEIYYFNGTSWVFANWLVPGAWIDILYKLEPGRTWDGQIYLNGTMAGKYKIVKEVAVEWANYSVVLEAYFTVVE